MIKELGEYKNLDYFSEAEDTPSIVSLRIKHPDTGAWMNKSELAKVFKAMTLDMSGQFGNADPIASKICFTGQPVLINQEQAVLRIALGSDSLRAFVEESGRSISEDYEIIKKLSFLGERYNEL